MTAFEALMRQVWRLVEYRCLQVSENSGLGNTSKFDLTVIWRGTIVQVCPRTVNQAILPIYTQKYLYKAH
jgi:hypothetical protein